MLTGIILERHGQSTGNNDKIYLNHTDLGLSEQGSIQAELTAGRFADEPIAAIYSRIPEKYFYAEHLAKLYTDSVLQKKQTLVTTPAFFVNSYLHYS